MFFFVFLWLILCYRAIHYFVGPSSVASQQFASTGAYFIARVVPTIPASFSYMHENTQSLMLSEARRDFSAINVIAATYYTSFGRVDGMIPNTIVSRLPSSEFADELLSSGLLSPGGFFATYYGAPSFQLLSILASSSFGFHCTDNQLQNTNCCWPNKLLAHEQPLRNATQLCF